jgi:taurine dioxygenase
MSEGGGLEVRRVAGALGAEVRGIDLCNDQPPEVIAALRQAWLAHGVLFFRDQSLSPAQYLRLAGWFGQPVEYPFIKGIDGFPMITPVVKLEHERSNFGGIWHSDTTYLEQPPMASMLIAREVPPFGGDTLFACQYRALDALSPALQATLATLAGVSSSSKADVSRTREDRIRDGGRDDARREYVAEHPVVRIHPETGRRALYVNVAHTARFAGWTEAESTPLLDYLFRHQVSPEFTCRFSWQPGSIAIWDNRCVQHNPVNDYHGHRRVMHRITLAGDRPR